MMRKVVEFRIPQKDFNALKKLVDDEYFMNISEACRQAVREMIQSFNSPYSRREESRV